MRPVRCVETGRVFPSAREAAHAYNLRRWRIYQAIHRGYAAAGYTWVYADSDQLPPPVQFHKHRPVRRNDGTVFADVRAAARACGISLERVYAAISRARRTGTPQRADGWGFEYVENSEHV